MQERAHIPVVSLRRDKTIAKKKNIHKERSFKMHNKQCHNLQVILSNYPKIDATQKEICSTQWRCKDTYYDCF